MRFESQGESYVLSMEIQVNFKFLSFIQNPSKLLQILNHIRFHLPWSDCAFPFLGLFSLLNQLDHTFRNIAVF